MELVHHPDALHTRVREWRREGRSVALVPTMGNLHAGHQSLIRRAGALADRVVASVFVNPTQFGPDEDYARYPRSLDADRDGLQRHGCDLLFAPTVETMYPFGVEASVRVALPQLTEQLEGAHRPGHFDGVTTVVAKLLSMVQPDVAVFGRKDYQQWRVIERMCKDLGMPVRVVAAPIVRDADGLALSSRNQYLDVEQRALAPRLHAALQSAATDIAAGMAADDACQAAAARLAAAGFTVDYLQARQAEDLSEAASGQVTGLVLLVAASLGSTRLIDNLEIPE